MCGLYLMWKCEMLNGRNLSLHKLDMISILTEKGLRSLIVCVLNLQNIREGTYSAMIRRRRRQMIYLYRGCIPITNK